MSIGFDLPAECGIALGPSPSLGKSKEKSLFACQSVDDNVWLAFERQDVSIMRRQQTRQIAMFSLKTLLPSTQRSENGQYALNCATSFADAAWYLARSSAVHQLPRRPW